MTRAEHLRWAKDRAIEYADRGETVLAVNSLASDLSKHPGTAGHAAVPRMVSLAAGGGFDQPGSLREFIEGFG